MLKWILGLLLAVSTPAYAQITAAPASQFHDTIGVVVQPAFVSEAEWNNDQWPKFIEELGVRNLRGKLSTNTTALRRLQPFFADGGKLTTNVVDQNPDLNLTNTKRNLMFLVNNVAPANIAGIESANEYNHTHSTADTARDLRMVQQWLRTTTSTIPSYANVPLISPSIYVRAVDVYKAVGSLEPWVDRWNLHYYGEGRRFPLTGGETKPGTLQQAILDARILAPTKKGYITEWGYKYVTPDASPTAGVLSELAASKYISRAYFDAYGAGVEKSYIYSLIDDAARGPINHGLRMDVANGLKARQSFYTLKNLSLLFRDKGGVAGAIPYTLSTPPASFKSYQFRKSDGTYLLAAYLDVDSWNRSTKKDINVAPVNVKVTFPAAVSKVEIFQPVKGAAPIYSATGVLSFNLPVVDHTSVIKITP